MIFMKNLIDLFIIPTKIFIFIFLYTSISKMQTYYWQYLQVSNIVSIVYVRLFDAISSSLLHIYFHSL